MLRLLLKCVLFLFLTDSEAVCNHQDREFLLWFSGNVSSSVSPLNWNPSIDCCSWEGITCDDSSNSQITAISLPFRGLCGKLALSFLSLSDNKLRNITGALSILQDCRKLSTLLIGNKFYNETLPSDKDLVSPDGFPNLQLFANGGSGLRGEIQAWLIKLKSIAVLDFSHNKLVGPI